MKNKKRRSAKAQKSPDKLDMLIEYVILLHLPMPRVINETEITVAREERLRYLHEELEKHIKI